MPPAPAAAAPSRPWWSRSKSSRDSLRPVRSVASLAEEDEKYASTASSASPRPKDALPSLKFNTLASAIGLKSKKLPALTIQDPPPPLPSPRAHPNSRPTSGNSSNAHSPAAVERTPFFTNRPPAKSISTVRSSEYDYDAASEPRTPSDHPRDRSSYQHSVMTFSEMDPFASGGIVVQHLPQDPNRLSVYSDSSMLDPQQKRLDTPPHNRGSYGSSSSNSHGNYPDVQALSPLSAASSFGRSPPASRSAYDLSQTHDPYEVDSPSSSSVQSRTRRLKTPSGSNSSNSTVTPHDYRARLSEPPAGGDAPHISRKRSSPTLARPRGMTVGAVEHRQPTPPVTLFPILPLQVRRKASGSSSPSPSNTPSPSPVTFSRTRSTSSTSAQVDSPTSSRRPVVVVRKASSSRLPPIPAAPPTSGLPAPPSSPYDMSPIEFRASSSSSSLNFAPSVDYHDLDVGDAISELMNSSYNLSPFEARDSGSKKGRRRSNRNMYVLDGDLSPVDVEASLPSPLSKFPPVPVSVQGEIHPKAGKFLRKMSSQQNLPQRHSTASTSSTGAIDEGHSHGHTSHYIGKTPRKQRSFHASRVPLPPLPGLRHGSSSNGHASTSTEALTQPSSPVVEPRRSSVTSPRKRLFSGSSARRSTSSHGPVSPSAEDDKRSIFSFDSDIRPATSSGVETITMSFGASGGPLSLMTRNACISPSSLWEDPGQKRASQSEYVPQYIMSPAEQLKLAEKLADEDATASIREPEPEPEERKPKLDLRPGDFGLTYSVNPPVRSRSNSVMSHSSTGTLAFGPAGDKAGVSRGGSILSSKSSVSGARPSMAHSPQMRKVTLVDPTRGGPSRSSSMLAKALNRPPPLSQRPSTAQASLTPPASPSFQTATHSPEFPSASLPPPPRRRPSRHDLQEAEAAAMKRVSVVPMNPLSPPPSVRTTMVRRQQSTDTMTSTMSRPPSSFDRQKVMQRRSLMKKPSFLEIEDEVDAMGAENGSDEEYGTATLPEVPDSPGADMESSFLDMDRGKNSFDTVRSTDSAFFV
ncbi:hypothetical protein K466DRAFT_509596 [Polyporus arcularius HHB13444]|uniref:Uncharacterized protein n=1 Tax=Polyporus arcularius HHB13444 TaxID=1314778 RepID=A0A5C3Q2H7_9APHY|nr:hypothetical protein K466DRAFT_509596 [Polyporus arcularius HHB13444]